MELSVLIDLASTAIVAVATFALAVLTGRYVRLTGGMVQEMKAQREPSVFLDFEHRQRMGALVVGNAGPTAAVNVRFEVRDEVPWKSPSAALGRLEVLKNGISYLPPHRTLKFELSTIDWDRYSIEGGTASFIVHYENESGQQFDRRAEFDMGHYHEVLYESFSDPVDHLTRAVRDLKKEQPRKGRSGV